MGNSYKLFFDVRNQTMSFSKNKEHPYTKQVTIQKFSACIKGVKAESFQEDVFNAIKNLGNGTLNVSKEIHIKCRRYEEVGSKLFVFLAGTMIRLMFQLLKQLPMTKSQLKL